MRINLDFLRHYAIAAFFGIVGSSTPAVGLPPTVSPANPAEQDEVATSLMRPGLPARYQSLEDGPARAIWHTIDSNPSLFIESGSPHPRIPPGPFEVVWTGWLEIREPGPFQFSALVAGAVELAIDAQVVLTGASTGGPTWVEARQSAPLEFGQHRFRCVFRSHSPEPAQLQLWWEGPRFVRERVPAHRLSHLPADLPADWPRSRAHQAALEWVEAYGCGRCHQKSFPVAADISPGPAIGPIRRFDPAWLYAWLENPGALRPDARMPLLFTPDERGRAERWIIATYLARTEAADGKSPTGDHRAGRQAFAGLGCAACHLLAEGETTGVAKPLDPERRRFFGLADRFSANELAAFLLKPLARYPDQRMPQFPMTEQAAADLTAYLLLWSKPMSLPSPPTPPEEVLRKLLRDLGASDAKTAAVRLIEQRRCGQCHPGLGAAEAVPLPIELARVVTASKAGPSAGPGLPGCLGSASLPRFNLDPVARSRLAEFLQTSVNEQHSAPVWHRQRLLDRIGCFRCHAGDGAVAAPLESAARFLWVSHLVRLPHQRTPSLAGAVARYTPQFLASAIRDGVSAVRPKWYSYRMPQYGNGADEIVRALAEREGEAYPLAECAPPPVADPTLAPLGPTLIGTEAYACISCHVWKGENRVPVEPGAAGPELTTVTRRVRREWFDRWLGDAQRLRPGTPMPTFFAKGERGAVRGVLDGEPQKQRDALWAYLAQGKQAPDPKPQAPVPLVGPGAGEPVLVAQIPLQMPGAGLVEALCLLDDAGRLFVYDLATMSLRELFVAAQLVRRAHVHWRLYEVAGASAAQAPPGPLIELVSGARPEPPRRFQFEGYDRLVHGVRLRYRAEFASGTVSFTETLRVNRAGGPATRRLEATRIPSGSALVWRAGLALPPSQSPAEPAKAGPVRTNVLSGAAEERDGALLVRLLAETKGPRAAEVTYALPPSAAAAPAAHRTLPAAVAHDIAPDPPVPGYRVLKYPIPKLANGEDRIMPTALAVDRVSRKLFIASAKMGELFVLSNPDAAPKAARFDDYAAGLFQDVFGLHCDEQDLFVLHRRNLTRIRDTDGDGRGDRFDRVAALPHAVGGAYDWAYGLVREPDGSFLIAPAPHANRKLRGSGGVLRLRPGAQPEQFEEVAYGLRNALGWCADPKGAVFFSDNQGEWVAANKICHLLPGHFYGFPNAEQPEHARRPAAPTALWVPYDWARSLNGIAYDDTGGRFGPFAGQLFLAELMHGGAILRAALEQVDGTWQGVCFPFWGRGLVGPLVLAFDPGGRLYVGSITEPGWMAQPDRGGLFALEFAGPEPFEILTIRVRPQGFRLVFTQPVQPHSAAALGSYRIEHYRYEYTSAYGSPELERTPLPMTSVEVTADRRAVDLHTAPLTRGRIYAISAAGVRSDADAPLVHPLGAYTLNEIPRQ